MIRIRNLQVPFDDERPLAQWAAKRLRLPPEKILGVSIVHKALDARRYRGAPIYSTYVLDVDAGKEEQAALARLRKDKQVSKSPAAVKFRLPRHSSGRDGLRPIVVGFGPAGMFAALALSRAGFPPIIVERGQDVDRRHEAVRRFWQSGLLDERTNVQFGEGGAGTFSDGKLTTRSNDPLIEVVLQDFVDAGAPEEIRYLHKPHIGTDILRGIVKRIRMEILRLGGEVRFSAQVTDLEVAQGHVQAVIINGEERIAAESVLLGIGHSARDTYAMLYEKGVRMEAKPFAVGVRIEHPQEWMDRAQYGADAGSPFLPAADYALSWQESPGGRGVYSFCMCPGGQVVAAASEKGCVATNGMSNYRRDSGIANSALLVAVRPEDFGKGALSGMAFQRQCEALAFRSAGGDYFAPVQTVGDFLKGTHGSSQFLVPPTYRPGVRTADLRECLPAFVTKPLADALPQFGRKITGFDDPSAVLTGVETRSSAPCRILRDRETFVSENIAGLYPIGEGAGYAGGIMSAAVDGMRAALALLQTYVE